MFSICIPTLNNNFNYLKTCLESLRKNSKLNNEIIIHVNEGGSDGTLEYVKNNNYLYTSSGTKLGLCSFVNAASKKLTKDNDSCI